MEENHSPKESYGQRPLHMEDPWACYEDEDAACNALYDDDAAEMDAVDDDCGCCCCCD